MSRMAGLLDHLAVILGIMFLVFLVLDQFNPMMNFIDNSISRWLLGAFFFFIQRSKEFNLRFSADAV